MSKDKQTSNEITVDNYFTYTEGTFTPCEVPDREPDYKSGRSSCWYTEEGLIRQSDLWGFGVSSCSWGMAGEEPAFCYKNKGLGQRAGFISWKDLRVPEKTLKVTHRFGELDYEKLGAEPIETGSDKFGDYDVFTVDRDWFEPGSAKYRFAGREIAPGKYTHTYTSALGDAYIDPRAQVMSLAWEAERQKCLAEKREIPEVDTWIATQGDNLDYGSLARELMDGSSVMPEIVTEQGEADVEVGLDDLESVMRDASTVSKKPLPQGCETQNLETEMR